MNLQEILAVLRSERHKFSEFPIRALFLFGSVVHGTAAPGSDVDILVEFEPGSHVGLFEFARLQRRLSDVLGVPVDLATPDALHKALRDIILKEAVRAA